MSDATEKETRTCPEGTVKDEPVLRPPAVQVEKQRSMRIDSKTIFFTVGCLG